VPRARRHRTRPQTSEFEISAVARLRRRDPPDFAALDLTDQQLALALKVSAGLVVNPGYQFGSRGRQHFRICFAQEEAEWEDALQRMGEVIAGFPVSAAP
jgi:aspartate/methionine/tyrosine aminotransferase